VGLGILIGIVGFSSLLKFLLTRYHRPTIGFLLGLLLGSVLGLYPFGQMSFEKLPRYAQTAVEDAPATLNVLLYNAPEDDHPVRRQLLALASDQLRVNFLPTVTEAPTAEAISVARVANAVVIAYDQNLPREVRRAAANKRDGKVELIVVPNTEFTPVKAALVLVLIVIGFFVTLGLGRLGGGEGSTAKKGQESSAGA
jgi:hypothetical protein